MFRLISVDEREKAAQQTSIKSINVGKLLQIELTQLPISNLNTSGQLRFFKGKGLFHNFTKKINLTKEGFPNHVWALLIYMGALVSAPQQQ